MTRRGFWVQTGLLTAGQGVYVASQWGMLIALARLVGPEAVGRFALALAVTAPIMLLSNLALRPALVTDISGEHSVRRYLALRASTTLLGLLAVAAAVILLRFERGSALLILIVGVAKALENLSDILYGLAQRHERFAPIALSLAARGLLGLAAFALGLWWSRDVIFGAALLAAAWAAVLLFFDWPLSARQGHGGPSAGHPRDWLRLAGQVLPLGAAVALISLNGNLPRYVIAERLGDAELGVFAALASFVVASAMLINILGQIASLRLARAGAAGDRGTYGKLLALMVIIGASFGGLGVAIAAALHRPVVRWLYGEAFVDASPLLVLLMIVALLSSIASCLGFGATALRIFRPAPLVHLAALTTNAIACAALIDYGVRGIVLAWMASLAVNIAGHLILIERRWRAVGRHPVRATADLAAAERTMR
jgi:O-antigen/teichoic acid export membrane protein